MAARAHLVPRQHDQLLNGQLLGQFDGRPRADGPGQKTGQRFRPPLCVVPRPGNEPRVTRDCASDQAAHNRRHGPRRARRGGRPHAGPRGEAAGPAEGTAHRPQLAARWAAGQSSGECRLLAARLRPCLWLAAAEAAEVKCRSRLRPVRRPRTRRPPSPDPGATSESQATAVRSFPTGAGAPVSLGFGLGGAI